MNRRDFLKFVTIAAIAASVLSFCVVTNSQEKEKMNKTASLNPKKILVIYFSHSGNTREIANQIKTATGGDIFELVPVNPYPAAYQAVVDQAKKEISANFKPELKNKLADISQYDVIFIGSPNWWSTIAPPVVTFLTSYDLSGKTIVPFFTHGGGSIGHCETDVRKHCPKSTVLKSLYIYGESVKNAQSEVSEWLREIKIIK